MEKALPILETGRTILRLACWDDVPAIIQYYIENRVYLTPFEPLRPLYFYTEKYWWETVQKDFEDFENDRSLRLFIFPQKREKVVIGSIRFSNFVRGTFQACTVGYSLAEAYQGKGYMSEALKVAIAYVFTDLNMHRITASYLPYNQRSGKLLKRLGFVVEGYARDYLIINGQWQDHIITSLINYNWKPT